jgi:hypothetical protein
VRLGLQTFRKFADRNRVASRMAGDLQKGLILKRCQAVFSAQIFAGAQKSTQAIAKVSQALEVGFDEVAHGS